MAANAGVLRSAASLDDAATDIVQHCLAWAGDGDTPEAHELANLVTVARAVVAAAAAREETRGCHTRTDFPEADEQFRVRLVL
jgi:succinate dehydrogenase/fumarate reductase flavoprotein subunit